MVFLTGIVLGCDSFCVLHFILHFTIPETGLSLGNYILPQKIGKNSLSDLQSDKLLAGKLNRLNRPTSIEIYETSSYRCLSMLEF